MSSVSKRFSLRLCSFMLIMLIVLTACATDGDPAEAVEQYLQAKVASDADALRRLLCTEMEGDLARETRTFESVTDVHIEDLNCARNTGGDTVTCTGQIVATYGTEQTTFPLSNYRVVQEDGEWKWCGEAG
jgi:hypothetical protein